MVNKEQADTRVEQKRRKTTEGSSEGEGRREYTKGINGAYIYMPPAERTTVHECIYNYMPR